MDTASAEGHADVGEGGPQPVPLHPQVPVDRSELQGGG